MRWSALAFLLFLFVGVHSEGGLDPPGLQPLVNRANVLLSSGQFNDAAKTYTQAIDLSPADYLLFYKRATAYFSLNRHSHALEDFNRVLSLTSNSFSNAYLMQARIHAKDGQFDAAREAIKRYNTLQKSTTETAELLADVEEAEKVAKKMSQERKSQLWTACVESASTALKTASHSIDIRQTRAECALASGDLEGAVGDFTRLSHLLPPSADLFTRLFRISYFLLPASPSAMSTLKQCLHSDPDSKPCLSLHRIGKNLDKGYSKVESLLNAEDWKGALTLLTGSGKANDLMNRFDEALKENTSREMLLGVEEPEQSKSAPPPVPLPNPMTYSPKRQFLVRALCKSYIRLNQPRKASDWCEMLLGMDGMSEDWDGLIGRGENLLLKEEYEDAVRVFDKAFEASGRSDRDIHARLSKAQKLLKQSRQKDYYKVLGVSRDADDRTIKKAFRRAAKTAHPDKGGTEAKMAAVNEAYEVLSDPELRARFDNGDDPNDPMAQQGGHPFTSPFGQGGGNPFSQFFQQQGGGFPGGGGSFQFHFGGR